MPKNKNNSCTARSQKFQNIPPELVLNVIVWDTLQAMYRYKNDGKKEGFGATIELLVSLHCRITGTLSKHPEIVIPWAEKYIEDLKW